MDCLFRVTRKSDGVLFRVYDVKEDKYEYPHFLIFEDNEWKYVKAMHFIPYTYYI